MVASCTPCDRSGTSSLVGQRVAVMRRRIAASSSSGTLTRNGRMLGASVVVLVSATGPPQLGVRFDVAPRWEVCASPAPGDVRDFYAEGAWPSPATQIWRSATASYTRSAPDRALRSRAPRSFVRGHTERPAGRARTRNRRSAPDHRHRASRQIRAQWLVVPGSRVSPDVGTLRRLYVGEELSLAATAARLGGVAQTVHNWLVAGGV